MKLVSPFDGVIGLRAISAGNFVNVGQTLVTVASIDPIKVDFRLPELYLGELRDNQKVEVRVDAFPNRRFAGEDEGEDEIRLTLLFTRETRGTVAFHFLRRQPQPACLTSIDS
jgi:multidrug efflux pump subunit AcrA (membrane-fusion protein)